MRLPLISFVFPLLGSVAACEDAPKQPVVPPSGLAGSNHTKSDDDQSAKAESAKAGHKDLKKGQPGKGLLDLPPDTVVARVNGKDVLQLDFMRSFGHQRRALNMHKGDLPPELLRVFERPAFDQLLKRTLLAQEAERQGLFPDDKRQKELFAQALKSQKNDKKIKEFFKEGSPARKAFVTELSTDDAIAKLVKQVQNEVKVTVAEAQAIFDDKGMGATEVMRLRRILLVPDAKEKETPEQLKTRAEALRQTLLQKDEATFAKAAQTHNDDEESKEKGGALGWVSKRQLLPQETDVATKAPLGDVSKVVLSERGAVIFFKAEVKEQKIVFADVKSKIIAGELQARARETINTMLTELKEKGEIVVMVPPQSPMVPGSLNGAKHPEMPKKGERAKPSAENVKPGMKNPHAKGPASSDGQLALPKTNENPTPAPKGKPKPLAFPQ
ncbi:MAG: hypothetical protein GY822_30165 [Deltaproteobacteria bacterium]|nr:hypothetical protein [Deltaproteobacteria bacterium]